MKRDMIAMPALRYGSVCSGIEAATVAWHPLDWKAAWFSEIEPFPSAVLAHHYPTVPNHGDMTLLADRVRSGEVEAPDVLVGGTPCQAYSVAGLRAGLADPRGALTIKYVELADEIDATRIAAGKPPVIIVWENVPGVLSSKDNAFGCFLGGLAGEDSELLPPGKKWADAGCVYGPKRTIAWRILDAQYIGLAQRRRRVFVVASARNDFDPTEVLFEFEGMRRDSPPSRETGEGIAGSLTASAGRRGGVNDPERGSLIASTGNISHCLNAGGMGRQDFETKTMIVQSVALRGRDGSDKPQGLAPVIAFGSKDNGRDATIDLSPTLRSGNHDKSHANGGQPPAIAFDCRQDPVSSTKVFGALGSSSPQAQAVCITGDIAHTLKADGFDASEDGTGRGQPIVAAFQSSQSGVRLGDTHATLDANNGPRRHNGVLSGMAVRRLTPRECERLQGFPDDYTLIPTARGSSVKPHEMEEWIAYLREEYPQITRIEAKQMAPDGPRYKALGNSMAVTCMAWLGRRIALALVPTNNIARVA